MPCRSWEQRCQMPWEAAGSDVSTPPGTSFLYPSLITVSRLQTIAGVDGSPGSTGAGGIGLDPYSDPTIGQTVLYTNIPANIEVRSSGRSKGPLPADVVYKPSWRIIVAAYYLAENDIRDRDLIVDDSGYRYAVTAAWWTPLGYTLESMRLEI